MQPALIKAAKEDNAPAEMLMQESSEQPKATSFFQTPKPPVGQRKTAGSAPPPLSPTKSSEGPVATVNLDSMPLPQFVMAVFGAILKRNVSMDPAVAQRADMVSLRTGKPQTEEQIFAAAQAVLRSYGLAVSEFNGLVRVVPESGQTGYLPEIRRGRAMPDVPAGLRPIFYLVELENTNVAQVVTWLRTLFPGRLTATDDAARNSILLSGQSDTVTAALEAIQLLDQPLMRGRLSARIAPVFWSADEMAKRLVEMLNAEGYFAAQAATAQAPILVLPIGPTNSVIVFAASQDVLNHVLRWAQELDQSPQGRGSGYINYYVRNTDATELATTLKEVLGESVAATTQATGTAAAPAASRGASKVVVNKAANSLIIKTTPAEYQQWYGLLQELDRPSRTALLMATVAEVRLTDAEQFGFQWMLKQFQSHGYNVNTGVTSAPGETSSVASGTFRIALATLSGDPRVLLTALASSNKIRILSNPSIMARSGESATIQVGQEVPILTSQISNANTGTTTGTGIQQTIQYRSTGVILKVKPVVHAGGRIDIDVAQEVSAAQLNETGVNTSPIILTRKVETKLSVTDGNTILLGGLIQEQRTKGNAGIPYLKDIPYVGGIFRSSNSDNAERTELVILLTPYVVEDDFDARSVTEAFRNQFSWAQDLKPAAALSANERAQTLVLPSADVTEKLDEERSSVKASNSQQMAKPSSGAPVAETPSRYRSKPYVLPEKEAPLPDSGVSVVPEQQSGTSAMPGGTSIGTYRGAPVINSVPVQDLSKQFGDAQPVTDEALKRELLNAGQGAASGARK
jgi:general secretion pathway protein D